MHLLSVSAFAVALFGLAAAGYQQHHGGASSYSVITKHDEPHHHYQQHGGNSLGGGYGGGYGGSFGGSYGGGKGGHHYAYKHEPYHYPKYQFDYGVKDSHTGDHKSQWEHRDGDHVKGGYTLKESDGTTRVVEYTADDHNGFNAVVKKIGHAHHPQIYHKSHHGGYGQDYGHHSHGHATSYVEVKQHH